MQRKQGQLYFPNLRRFSVSGVQDSASVVPVTPFTTWGTAPSLDYSLSKLMGYMEKHTKNMASIFLHPVTTAL